MFFKEMKKPFFKPDFLKTKHTCKKNITIVAKNNDNNDISSLKFLPTI